MAAARWLDIILFQAVSSRLWNDKFMLSEFIQNSLPHSVGLFCPSTYLSTVGDFSCTRSANSVSATAQNITVNICNFFLKLILCQKSSIFIASVK